MFNLESTIAEATNKTDLERAEWQRFQDVEKAKLPSFSATKAKYELGLRQIALSESEIKHLLPQDIQNTEMFDRLAEGYALIGDLDEALRYVQTTERKNFYLEIAKALKTINCGCLKGQFTQDIFHSAKHKREVELVKCLTCQTLFVK